MTENKPWWKLNGLNSAFYQMFFCSELMSSTRLAALSVCWGKINLQIPTICRKDVGRAQNQKNTERRDIKTPAPSVGRSGGEYTISNREPAEGQSRSGGPDLLRRTTREGSLGHGGMGYAALGNTSALSASSFAHCWCLFSSRRAYSNVGAPSWP